MEMLDIIDNPIVQSWMQTTYKFNPVGLARLFTNNTDRLTLIYGTPKSDKGSYFWPVSHNGLDFVIITGKNGTIFRIKVLHKKTFYEDYRIANGINKFLEDLITKLSGC